MIEIQPTFDMRPDDDATSLIHDLPGNVCTRRKTLKMFAPTSAAYSTNNAGQERLRTSTSVPLLISRKVPDIVRRIKVRVVFPHLSTTLAKTAPLVRVKLNLEETPGLTCYDLDGSRRLLTHGNIPFKDVASPVSPCPVFDFDLPYTIFWHAAGCVMVYVYVENLTEEQILAGPIGIRVEVEAVRLTNAHYHLLTQNKVLWKVGENTYLFHQGKCAEFNHVEVQNDEEKAILRGALLQPGSLDPDDVTAGLTRYVTKFSPSGKISTRSVVLPLAYDNIKWLRRNHHLPDLDADTDEEPEE